MPDRRRSRAAPSPILCRAAIYVVLDRHWKRWGQLSWRSGALVKIYFPAQFKNEDVKSLISGMALGFGGRPIWSFDEKGFWVEVPEADAEEWRVIIGSYLARPN